MKVVGEHIRGAYDYIEKTEGIDVFGKPTDALLEMLRQAAPPGTPCGSFQCTRLVSRARTRLDPRAWPDSSAALPLTLEMTRR
jgi:hypothetical protein